MARDNIANFAQLASKAASLKIIGWTAKYSRESLFECLATLGHIQTFVHYPQLNTTYVKMRVSGRSATLVAATLAKSFPRAKVEVEETCDILQAEKKLEKPEVTAFISSRKFFTEISVFNGLKQFGMLRALNLIYSTKSQSWFCKASFYEQYSIELLLDNKPSVKRDLSDGTQIKLERVRGLSSYESTFNNTRLEPVQEVQGNLGQMFGEKQQNSTKQYVTAFSNLSSTNTITIDTLRTRKARSYEKIQNECLPAYTTFKNTAKCIENTLKIHRSRRQEKGSLNLRYKSSDKSARDQIQVKLATTMVVKTLSSRKLVVNSYTFEENELLFLEIGNKNQCNQKVPGFISIEQPQQPGELSKDQLSYLSLDDLSEGYSAIEEGAEFGPIKEETFQVLFSSNSGNDASLILKTKHSSAAGHLFRKSHSGSQYDFVFSSDSAHNGEKVHMADQSWPVVIGLSKQPFQFQFFTHPCY